MRFPLVCFSLLALAACGGGETPPPEPPEELVAFADPTSQATSTLQASTLTSATRTTASQTGSLNREANTFTLGGLSGFVSDDRTEVNLNGGGVVVFDPAGNTFSTRFSATPQGGDVTLGVVGVVTPDSQMPTSGSATYSGSSVVTIQDDFTLYDLTGDVTIAASFGAGTVTTTVNGLSGSATSGGNNPVTVTNVGTISFTGSTLDGATYTGGLAQVTSNTVSGLTSGAESSLVGTFFGPDGSETGGVFLIEDETKGVLTIFGDFIAN